MDELLEMEVLNSEELYPDTQDVLNLLSDLGTVMMPTEFKAHEGDKKKRKA